MKVRPSQSQATWNDYQARILRALTHIQERLDETLDLEALAQVACFSSFHFHRIFAAMTGETIADHVRRLRLERAALELRNGGKQVVTVALDAGYEAHEAFTRAFKAAYGVSPAEFRRATGPITVLAAPSGVHFRPGIPLTTFNTNHLTTKSMKVITKKIKPRLVAYLRHVGPYEETGATWSKLAARLAGEKRIHKGSIFIGIGHDNPSDTPAAELRYDACITVDEDYQPKRPVQTQVIAGGDFATVQNCPVPKIKEAFQHLFGKWLARSGRELRPAPSFAVMVDAQKAVPPEKRRVDIYVPLQPKRQVAKSQQMSIEVTTLEPRRVAYMRHVGPYREAYRTWQDFTARLRKAGLSGKGSIYIGVPMDDPKATPESKLRYDACMTVDETYAPQKPVRVKTLPGGDFVVARNCPIGAIAQGYEKLYRSWLPGSGRVVRKEPSFLVAVDGHEEMPPGFGYTDIYLPLEAKN
ncbi:MAG TPA: GyrI-like domain-containing protein [Verrucomicrobiae bacterium]|jgi:AraC family transcriptional regulator|nr:GyrI-like domain-containing protein [Verrucomicrobiae bacterium]